jgi:predicted phosphodiesterase
VRVAALYDIHGNLPALDAVLRDVAAAGVDEIVIGGDVIPGPMPRECLERLLEMPTPTRFISGNCEREALTLAAGNASSRLPESVQAALRWAAEQLAPDLIAAVAGWPATSRLSHESLGDVLFCHATPRNDSEIFTRLTPEAQLRPVFERADAAIVVCGHTHMQFDRQVGATRVVNAGSVGMPFQAPGGYWLLLAETLELRRTDYDRARAAELIRATRYPQAEEFAQRYVLDPPSEEETLAQYSRVELRG